MPFLRSNAMQHGDGIVSSEKNQSESLFLRVAPTKAPFRKNSHKQP